MNVMAFNNDLFVEVDGRWTRFNKKTREGPNFPPKNPGKGKTKKRKKGY